MTMVMGELTTYLLPVLAKIEHGTSGENFSHCTLKLDQAIYL